MTLAPELVDKYNRAAYLEMDDEVYRVIAFDDVDQMMYIEHEETGDSHQLDPEELTTVSRFYEIVEIK